MSYFEYVISGELTPEFEEITQTLVSRLNNGTAFYNIQKYWDEEITSEKKNRIIILTSQYNVMVHLFNLVKQDGINFAAYYKQRII